MPLRNESPGPTVVVTAIDLNPSAATDTFIPIGTNKCIVRRVTLYDASASLAAGSAQVALYTLAAAGGTAIVAPAVVTSLTAATKFSDRTVATSADYVRPTAGPAATAPNQSGFYFRVTVANGTAATVSVALELEALD
jgi:hypothetical protein